MPTERTRNMTDKNTLEPEDLEEWLVFHSLREPSKLEDRGTLEFYPYLGQAEVAFTAGDVRDHDACYHSHCLMDCTSIQDVLDICRVFRVPVSS